MNKREIGAAYEDMARTFIQDSGAVILASNFRSRKGEIDIVCRDGRYIAFVEVKYRSDGRLGHPEEAVSRSKMMTICRVSDFYRYRYHIRDNVPVRFDVIAVEGSADGTVTIRWHKNAFEYLSV